MIADELRSRVQELLPDAQRFLCRLIEFPSTSGREHEALCFLKEEFEKLDVDVEPVPMSNSLRQDPDYSDPVPDIEYDGRFNLRVVRKGSGGGNTLLFNTHTDVVPPSEGMTGAWTPSVENGIVYGRGACDAKGQVATLYLLLRFLDSLDVKLQGDLVLHIVNEEENGGNGTLAMARHGETADGCIVLEPSEHKLFTSIRGAVWFRLVTRGKAGHSGQAGVTRSALLMARDAMTILEDYHARLLADSRGLPLFDPYPNPMPITFGKLQAGNWPASAPSEAILEGVLGLLPNKTKDEVCDEMRQAIVDGADEFLANSFDLSFMYRHDSSVLSPDHPLPRGMLAAAGELAIPLGIDAMTASCDAWMYNNQLDIPTVVYGPGSLKVAHSKDEQIALADMAEAAVLLTEVTKQYCGVNK
ncbi:MAG: M20/M25/M40 family metallo-hydrolase [Lentisphaerae bacterium]|nr:M20/M25/M40 family metallo-hydrolase [Lentisphaerota bacterium]